MNKQAIYPRIGFILLSFFLAGLGIVGRVYYLQIFKGRELYTRMEMESKKVLAVESRRGSIYDRIGQKNGQELAISIARDSVYAEPRNVVNPEKTAEILADVLGGDETTYLRRLRSRKGFCWIKRQISQEETDRLDELAKDPNLIGIGRNKEYKRIYPHGKLLGHVLGFTNIDAQGLEGLERQYNYCLQGQLAKQVVGKDAKNHMILWNGIETDFYAPTYGCELVLTLDQNIQYQAEQALKRQVEKTNAKGGVAIVADPRTGAILAMAIQPDFDPNQFASVSSSFYRNRALTDTFEPGSTFKAFVVAAGLESKRITPADRIYCERGSYRYANRTIHDTHAYDWLPIEDVVKFSSNIGATKIAEKLGKETFFQFIQNFGFGKPTGIDLGGETSGILRHMDQWAKIDLATHAYGQGISVTPIQLLMAYCAIANGGKLLRPFLVQEVRDYKGNVIATHYPEVIRQAISQETATTLSKMLERVVEPKGTGTKAAISGYRVAGKTGTAQKAKKDGRGYSSTDRIGSFIGFVPAENPRLVTFVLIDEPQGSQHQKYGGIVAAPVWQEINQWTLSYLGILPSLPQTTTTGTVAKASNE